MIKPATILFLAYIVVVLHHSGDGDRFECSIKGDQSYKAQLWHWCEGNWNGEAGIPCEIEFTEVNSVGLPTNAVITKVEGFYAMATT